jgi:hypothetical protein
MLVWQGWGILVVGVPLVLIVVTSVIWTAIFGEASATENSSLILGIALLVSAPIIYLLGKRLDARPGRSMIDKETGEYLSEDYAFCRRWRDLGGEIWVDLESKLTHVGAMRFVGDLSTQFDPLSENGTQRR